MRKVVDPGEQTEGEEEGGDGHQFGKGSPRPLQDGPALKELHEQAGEDAELAARRTHLGWANRKKMTNSRKQQWLLLWLSAGDAAYLGSVGQEDGWGQVAGDAAQHVDDGDPQPASQLLYVPQHRHLEEYRHQAVQDPTDADHTEHC